MKRVDFEFFDAHVVAKHYTISGIINPALFRRTRRNALSVFWHTDQFDYCFRVFSYEFGTEAFEFLSPKVFIKPVLGDESNTEDGDCHFEAQVPYCTSE